MKSLLNKEIRLAASPLSWFFLAAALMTMLPGYPILMSAFFICMGLFQSFQNAREANDVLYTALLPVKKRDYVRAKYAFCCLIEMIGFLLCSALTAVRVIFLSTAPAYIGNALMNATPVYLAFILLIFTAFNTLFIGGFFRTGYRLGMPFLSFSVATFLIVAVGEALQHVPGLTFLHSPAVERPALQYSALAGAAAVYAVSTILACRRAERRFERIDL